MFLNLRQLPRMSTPGFAMSNTTGQGDTQPTEEASVPNNQPTPDASNQSTSADAAPSSAAPAPESSSEAPAEEPSTTDDIASDTPTNSPSDDPTPTVSETPPEETTDDATATPTESDAQSSAADPTTQAPDPSSTDDNNNDTSSDDNEPTVTDITQSEVLTTYITVSGSGGAQTSLVIVTRVTTNRVSVVEPTASASATDDEGETNGGGSSNDNGGGLDQKGRVAVGVAVPIAAIALFALLGLFWWKKRKTRRQAEEERRKEVEDYAYNPNADPTIPAVGMADGGYEMREDGSSGYRGWGNTTIGSTGRKASTTMSGGVNGQAYSDVTSPIRGNMSDARSGEPLMDGAQSPEGEILGAMGPSAANNRGGADVHRGPSNASSSYSAAGRSDASDPMAMPYAPGGAYYDQYAQNNPYNDSVPQQAVIRDNPARRNTRIESPSHYPQQSAGISQNF
ncbi:hypothetical protein FZEAL_5807 [Fusarium zealandicum]|uniref:Serine-rich protein n=1 Tax=Fusarium zealandicum TaxID=1053134 RepID=A0A8H4UJH5_9HYPO|nr:hypothetical protein FZEAL_5807 [Fusarium zealandicum]